MPSPADLLRLPREAVGGVRRILSEIVLVRQLLEVADARVKHNHEELMVEVGHMRGEMGRVRDRLDELADTVPTTDGRRDGPLKRAAKALADG